MKAFEVGKTYKTRDGRDAHVLKTDVKVTNWPIVAVVTNENGSEYVLRYDANGVTPTSGYASAEDLMPEVEL